MFEFKTPIKLERDEEFILKVHHYFFVFAPHLAFTFLIIVLDFFLLFLLFRQGNWGVWIFLAVLAFSVFYGLRVIFFWYKNYFVITDKRLIDFDQSGLFSKKVSDLPFENIKEVSFRQQGFWQTALKFGNIHLSPINTDKSFVLFNIKDPGDVQSLLSKFVKKSRLAPAPENSSATDDAEDLSPILAQIGNLSDAGQMKLMDILKNKLMADEDKIAIKHGKSTEKEEADEDFLKQYWKEENI
ncbi:MAG: PH domain-containing protein [Patescibacteria group bacterium]